MCEEAHDGRGEDRKEEADSAEKEHVVKAGAPYGFFGAFGLLGAEVLADKRSGGVAEPPGGQQDKDNDANGDGVAGECRGAKDADDADEANPAGVGDGELQDARQRNTKQTQQNGEIQANLAAEDADALAAAQQAVELIQHANAAARERGQGGAGDTELGEWSPAEDQARVEDEIDDVRDPQ